MKKKILLLIGAMLSALLLTGCAMRTIDELYAPPKRSEEYSRLQSAIDIAMAGLEYSAPLTGENQQAVQMADLDGDGVEEYLVFARGNSDNPMQILIFSQLEDGDVQIEEIITSNGSAFELVQYVEIDGKPGLELVVGRQVSDQLMGSVSVYSFSSGRAERLVNAGYSKLMTLDLGGSDQKELLLIQRGESDQANAVVVLYRYRNKSMVRSVEVELSRPAANVKQVTGGKLQCGTPAVYVTSAMEGDSVRTEVLTVLNDRFTKLSVMDPSENIMGTLDNYYVYPDDVDEDGIMEIPGLIPVKPLYTMWNEEEQFLIRWYSVDKDGQQQDKLYSFHRFSEGWYLTVVQDWIGRLTVNQVGSTFVFYMWDEDYKEAFPVFTIYALSGSDRQTQATEDGRFILQTGEDVIYAARLEADVSQYGIDQTYLMSNFHRIHQDWNTGEA